MLGLDAATLITKLIILLIAFPVHEFAHAWTANYFGDDTPRLQGRLTLNPLAHLDVMGSLMLLVAWFGWAKPVMVNPYALRRRSPAAPMLVSLAGPMSNFLLAILAAIPFRLGLVTTQFAQNSFLPSLSQFLQLFILINLLLMFFNLIPLAPLDGEKILDYFLPAQWARWLEDIRPYGPVLLLLILFVGPMVGIDLFGWLIWPPISWLTSLLTG